MRVASRPEERWLKKQQNEIQEKSRKAKEKMGG